MFIVDNYIIYIYKKVWTLHKGNLEKHIMSKRVIYESVAVVLPIQVLSPFAILVTMLSGA